MKVLVNNQTAVVVSTVEKEIVVIDIKNGDVIVLKNPNKEELDALPRMNFAFLKDMLSSIVPRGQD